MTSLWQSYCEPVVQRVPLSSIISDALATLYRGGTLVMQMTAAGTGNVTFVYQHARWIQNGKWGTQSYYYPQHVVQEWIRMLRTVNNVSSITLFGDSNGVPHCSTPYMRTYAIQDIDTRQ